jgi:hypothetical protein
MARILKPGNKQLWTAIDGKLKEFGIFKDTFNQTHYDYYLAWIKGRAAEFIRNLFIHLTDAQAGFGISLSRRRCAKFWFDFAAPHPIWSNYK